MNAGSRREFALALLARSIRGNVVPGVATLACPGARLSSLFHKPLFNTADRAFEATLSASVSSGACYLA
jgi:hypothetical protein